MPDEVAISEAVSIVKKYSTAKSGPFVNGILASVYKELN
ncbi:MAG TPA: transcription antitermination factor NusB [Clostridia bacterium]|nr:transcription antitermination factor NusB [Clostridia bacterium]